MQSESEALEIINFLGKVLAGEYPRTCIFCGVIKHRNFYTNNECIKKIRKRKGFVCANCAWNVVEILDTNEHGGFVEDNQNDE